MVVGDKQYPIRDYVLHKYNKKFESDFFQIYEK